MSSVLNYYLPHRQWIHDYSPTWRVYADWINVYDNGPYWHSNRLYSGPITSEKMKEIAVRCFPLKIPYGEEHDGPLFRCVEVMNGCSEEPLVVYFALNGNGCLLTKSKDKKPFVFNSPNWFDKDKTELAKIVSSYFQ